MEGDREQVCPQLGCCVWGVGAGGACDTLQNVQSGHGHPSNHGQPLWAFDQTHLGLAWFEVGGPWDLPGVGGFGVRCEQRRNDRKPATCVWMSDLLICLVEQVLWGTSQWSLFLNFVVKLHFEWAFIYKFETCSSCWFRKKTPFISPLWGCSHMCAALQMGEGGEVTSRYKMCKCKCHLGGNWRLIVKGA